VPAAPSGAIKNQPVPKPVRKPPPSAVNSPTAIPPAVAGPPAVASEAETPPVSDNPLAGITKVGIPGTQSWQRTTRQVSRNTPRPGRTQALRVGPGDSGMKAQVTSHSFRNQDRVNIRQEIDVDYTVTPQHGDDTGAQTLRGRLVDISLGGAQIEGPLPSDVSPQQIKKESFVCDAIIALPFVEHPLNVTSQITWAKPSSEGIYFLGLKFINVVEQHRRTIQAFLIGLQSPTKSKFKRGI
jgi:hypothetical protein